MTDTPHNIDTIVATTLGALDQDAASRDVLLQRRLLAEHAARLSTATETSVPAAPRTRPVRRRRQLALGVLVGAAAIVLVVALGPGSTSTNRSHLPTPDSAEAALIRAGDAAGNGAWTPLGDDEYFHVGTMNFTPDIPGEDAQGAGAFLSTAFAGESWIGRDGAGFQLILDGGDGKPETFPSISRDPTSGKITGTGNQTLRADQKVDLADTLAHPDIVTVLAWPRDGDEPFQRSWARTRTGFFKIADLVMNEETMGRSQSAANTIGQAWGTSIARIDAANEHGDPTAAARELIDSFVSDPKRPPSMGGGSVNGEETLKVDDEVLDREAGIEHAIQLLGSAPLSPDVRRELFRWLASQPGARVKQDVVDELGRPGTEVTFETLRTEPIPDYTTTAAEVLATFRRGSESIRGIESIDPKTTYTVTGNVQRRRWRVSVIVDIEHGELLQQYTYFRQARVGKRPVFTTWAKGPRIDMRDPGGGIGAGGGHVYLARDTTTRIEPAATVCKTDPQVCS